MTIPFVAVSPQARPASKIEQDVSILDIAPTITRWLGIETPADWTGKAIDL
jgi:arylsulfatase A-like enzyme